MSANGGSRKSRMWLFARETTTAFVARSAGFANVGSGVFGAEAQRTRAMAWAVLEAVNNCDDPETLTELQNGTSGSANADLPEKSASTAACDTPVTRYQTGCDNTNDCSDAVSVFARYDILPQIQLRSYLNPPSNNLRRLHSIGQASCHAAPGEDVTLGR